MTERKDGMTEKKEVHGTILSLPAAFRHCRLDRQSLDRQSEMPDRSRA